MAMNNRYARILVTGGAAVLMAALGGPAALATAATNTWTVRPGGTITAKAGKITLTNAAPAHPVTCVSAKGAGTLRSGSGLPGAGAGSLSAIRFPTCAYHASTTLEIIFTVRPGGLPWQVNFSSYNAATGVVRGTLSHIALTVAAASTPPGCRAIVGGTSATAGDGRVAFRYTASTGQLTVLTTGGNLHYYDVRSCRLFPGFHDNAPATLSATFTVSPHQDITSP
jgi:hypothetical protein